MTELDILKETLENMIYSTESRFREIIDSLKANIFDIENDKTLSTEERYNVTSSYYDELEKYESQRYLSRNKLVICIYSICEIILAGICVDNSHKPVKMSGSIIKPLLCPNLGGRVCNVKRSRKPNYHLKDYLYTLDPEFITDWNDARIVSTAIRNLRNYLSHRRANAKYADKLIKSLSECGIKYITQINGNIIIDNIESIWNILEIIFEMLKKAEEKAEAKN